MTTSPTRRLRDGLERRRLQLASVILSGLARLPLERRRKALYLLMQNRRLDLEAPSTFNEKVNWRIVYDRRALIAMTCDKLEAKAYAAERGVAVPETLWSGTDLGELHGVDLPGHWVLKPNHQSGLVHMGHGRDLAALPALTQGWLDEVLWEVHGEWAYSQAGRCLLVEERIGTPEVDLPDYKFFVFDGHVEFVQVDVGRWERHRRTLYTRDWTPIDGRLGEYPQGPVTPRPDSLPAMVAAAETLGADFDFIRVDLYSHGGTVWFGELTPYPGAGLKKFSPHALDRKYGELWSLPAAVSA